jgi:hypothetical protein
MSTALFFVPQTPQDELRGARQRQKELRARSTSQVSFPSGVVAEEIGNASLFLEITGY